MYRSLVAVIFLVFAFSGIKAQAAKPDCSNFTGGTYIKGNFIDSVLVYRGLEYWIEADMKAHECRVYKIEWTDACNFMLVFNNYIDENKKNTLRKKISDTVYYSTSSIDSSGVIYQVKNQIADKQITYQKLRPLHDSLAWEYLVYTDTNLYFDTTEIRQLYGMPAQRFFLNLPSFIIIQTDSADSRFATYMVSLFETGDIKPAFDFASPVLKKHSPESILDDYNQYVQHVFGKLKSYKTASLKIGYRINKSIYTHSYVINGTFEKLNNGASICITTAPGSSGPLQSLSVTVDSANKIPYLNEMTRAFWTNLKHKKYHKIYDSSATLLKKNIPFAQAEQTLRSIDSLGHLDNYKIFFLNFNVEQDKDLILVSYKCQLQNKAPVVNLFYTFENGEYKLASLNFRKN